MNISLFDHRDYKSYLNAVISAQPKRGRGMRSALAAHLRCQGSHISQVLNGDGHLSLEQADQVNQFFGHSKDEAKFFLLLVQLARAGTASLKSVLNVEINECLEKQFVLKDRLGVKKRLSSEDQTIYYSSWHYAAIHLMLTVRRFQTKEAIAAYLGISLTKVSEILGFLVSAGLAIQTAEGYGVGEARIFLGNDSPMIAKHHTNWRMRAIDSLDRERFAQDLHYSSVVSISDEDFIKIKSLLVKNIETAREVIRGSQEEGVYCFSLDFFAV